MTDDDGSVSVCVYRLIAQNTRTKWQIVARPELAQESCDAMNSYDSDGAWSVELLPARIPLNQIRPLIGYLCGSQTGGHKARVARLNGKKGGRPKKPIDGLKTPKNTPIQIQNQQEHLEANLPPL